MFTIFDAIYNLLKNRVSVKVLHYYGENFADFTFKKDGHEYTVSIRKEEQKDA